METVSTLKRLVYYLLYFVLIVIVYYFVSSAGLFFFHDGVMPLTEESLLNNVLLPYLYAFLSFGIALLVQLLLIRKPRGVAERKIYGWGLAVLYVFHLSVTAIVLIVGGVSVSGNDPSFLLLLVPCLPLIVLGLGELFYAALLLVDAYKEEKEKKVFISVTENNEIVSKHGYNE